MARINLLPWREAERKRRQREFAGITGAALAGTALLALAVHFQMESVIAAQQGRNQYLQSQIAALDVQIKKIDELEATKANLLSRMNIIQRLQESRPEVVHLFDELVKTIPEGTFLTKVDQTGSTITVEGQAQSNARVSSFMRNIEASEWLTRPSLQLIENKDQTGAAMSRFRLRFDQRQLASDEEAPATDKKAGGKGGKAAKSGKAAKPAKPGKTQKTQKPT
jgi:type IV pilus assembly protein PilN